MSDNPRDRQGGPESNAAAIPALAEGDPLTQEAAANLAAAGVSTADIHNGSLAGALALAEANEGGHLWASGRELVKAYKVGAGEVRGSVQEVALPPLSDEDREFWGVPKPTWWRRLIAPIREWWCLRTLTPQRVYFCPECLHDF